jgi:Cdc6-like AAA superfamily ATPase
MNDFRNSIDTLRSYFGVGELKTLYGWYDVSDENLRRLLEIAKQTDEIKYELKQPRVLEEVRRKIDSQVMERKDQILVALVGDNTFDNFMMTAGINQNSSARKFWQLLTVVTLFLLTLIYQVAMPYVENYLNTFAFFANQSNTVVSSLIIYFPVAVVIALISRIIVKRMSEKNKLYAARAKVDDKLITAFLFELRQAINQHIQTFSFDKQLKVVVANGLEEGYDVAFEVDTPARKYAETLIAKMSRGSIGVAGPRGTGKTTLLRASEGFTSSEEKRVFVQVSAPVMYDAKDFILYLFSAICNEVIRKIDPKQQYESMLLARNKLRNGLLNRYSFIFIVTLVLVLFFSVYFLSFVGKILFGNYPVVIFDTPINVLPEGQFLLIAILIFVFGFWFAKFYASAFSEFFSTFLRSPGNRVQRTTLLRAYTERRRLRYQQTLSSNASGKLSVAVLEATSEQGLSLLEYPMSLPEVTFAYRDFINHLSEQFQFVIAIDELDKIEDPLQAQSFLNDLKNILSLKNCFYMVSVSQNAMSSFELRGLPFRDAFDSTFDEIVHLDYLNYETASLIINRRLIGVPEPFAEFAYTLSGGLPRDLIRVMRKLIIENIKNGGTINIANATFQLLYDDMKKKLDAVRHQIQENNWVFSAQDVLTKIDNLEDDSYSALRMGEVGAWLVAQRTNKKDWQGKDFYKLKLLVYELGLYMLYVATLMEFFTMSRSKKNYANVAKPNPLFKGLITPSIKKSPLDMLVVARQCMSLNGEYSLMLINKFREIYGIRKFKV